MRGISVERRRLTGRRSDARALSCRFANPTTIDGPLQLVLAERASERASVLSSYISGKAGRWAGNTTDMTYQHIDALGANAYFDNPGHTAELIHRCHRSRAAEVFIGGGVHGKTLACSGATTTTFTTKERYFKPGLDFHSHGPSQHGQAAMLRTFAEAHNVKMVVISIGGNNFRFSEIVRQCVTDYMKPYAFSPYLCTNNSRVLGYVSAAEVAKQTAAIRLGIDNIVQAMRNAHYRDSAYTILVQDYEAAVPRGTDIRYPPLATFPNNRPRQMKGGCGFWNEDVNWAIDTALPTINRAVRSAANQARLTNLKFLELSQAFDGRALCARGIGLLEDQGLGYWNEPGAVDKTEWIDQIRIVTSGTHYYHQESLHPNYWGQLALRNCIRQAYNAGSPRGGRCKIAGDGVNDKGEPMMTLTALRRRGT